MFEYDCGEESKFRGLLMSGSKYDSWLMDPFIIALFAVASASPNTGSRSSIRFRNLVKSEFFKSLSLNKMH